MNDPATAAPTARRGSSTSFGSPPVPLVATTAHARSGSAGVAPPNNTSSSGVTSIVGDARAMSAALLAVGEPDVDRQEGRTRARVRGQDVQPDSGQVERA